MPSVSLSRDRGTLFTSPCTQPTKEQSYDSVPAHTVFCLCDTSLSGARGIVGRIATYRKVVPTRGPILERLVPVLVSSDRGSDPNVLNT